MTFTDLYNLKPEFAQGIISPPFKRNQAENKIYGKGRIFRICKWSDIFLYTSDVAIVAPIEAAILGLNF